jgi:hypothetical protein
MVWLPSRWVRLPFRALSVTDRLVDEPEGDRERLQIGIACLLSKLITTYYKKMSARYILL